MITKMGQIFPSEKVIWVTPLSSFFRNNRKIQYYLRRSSNSMIIEELNTSLAEFSAGLAIKNILAFSIIGT